MTNLRLYKLIYWGAFTVAFGIFISVSLPSLFHIFAVVPLLVFNYRLVKEKSLNLPTSAKLLLLLVVLGYLSNFINLSELNNVTRSFGKLKYFIFGVLSIGGFRLLTKDYLTSFRAKKVLNTFWVSIIIAGLYGIFKERIFYEDIPGRVGGLTGIMRYGYGMSFVLTIMAGIVFRLDKLNHLISKKLFLSALVIGFLGFFFSQTRGAMLGLIASAPFVIYYYNKKAGVASLILAILAIGSLAYISISGGNSSSRFFARLGSTGNMKRLSQYEMAYQSIKEKPWFGVGVNNISSKCSEIKDRHEIDWRMYCKYDVFKCAFHEYIPKKQYCAHSHNIVLEIAANFGIIGGVLLILWGGIWFIELYKLNTTLSIIILPFIINMFAAGQFENIFDANNSFLIFFLYPLSFLRSLKETPSS